MVGLPQGEFTSPGSNFYCLFHGLNCSCMRSSWLQRIRYRQMRLKLSLLTDLKNQWTLKQNHTWRSVLTGQSSCTTGRRACHRQGPKSQSYCRSCYTCTHILAYFNLDFTMLFLTN
jgi:hypothetical protein